MVSFFHASIQIDFSGWILLFVFDKTVSIRVFSSSGEVIYFNYNVNVVAFSVMLIECSHCVMSEINVVKSA